MVTYHLNLASFILPHLTSWSLLNLICFLILTFRFLFTHWFKSRFLSRIYLLFLLRIFYHIILLFPTTFIIGGSTSAPHYRFKNILVHYPPCLRTNISMYEAHKLDILTSFGSCWACIDFQGRSWSCQQEILPGDIWYSAFLEGRMLQLYNSLAARTSSQQKGVHVVTLTFSSESEKSLIS